MGPGITLTQSACVRTLRVIGRIVDQQHGCAAVGDTAEVRPPRVIDILGVDELIGALRERAYTVIGPVERDSAICYGEIAGVADLPAGRVDVQDGGTYRLRDREDHALFGYAVGPDSFKRFLLPPSTLLMDVSLTDGTMVVDEPPAEPRRYAFFGARPCDLAGIAIHDRVLLSGVGVDTVYAANRASTFVVAVQCAVAGGTCFCASMGTGPRAEEGFDLALTELLEGDRHRFLVEVGSPAGAAVLAEIGSSPASTDDRAAAAAVSKTCAEGLGRFVETAGLHDDLLGSLEHPRWEETAARCLSCANCTMVCPTCFCTSIVDGTSMDGTAATRTREWDSCFTVGFSYIHGGSIRPSVAARYRQWLTHKLATWIDQFGTSGCVGCGRCITWCPVGIDLTEEVAALRIQPGAMPEEVR
jgi:sulfhydrogenase subunit beta (sulfur reductase)